MEGARKEKGVCGQNLCVFSGTMSIILPGQSLAHQNKETGTACLFVLE